MAASLWLFLFANSLLIRSTLAANAAFNKTVEAEPSCGVNVSERYFHISQVTILPFNQNISICDQNISQYAHPPQAVVDENFATYWQAKGGEDKARITIDLTGLHQKFYYVKSITISFGDYYRPDQIAFYKNSNTSGTFDPWHYIVTSRDECIAKFGVEHQNIPAFQTNVLCTVYDNEALQTNENVTIELEGGRGRIVNGNNGDKQLNVELLNWMNTTEVELRFSGLRLFPDRLANQWRHYVVREVSVEAYCHCNGHANGINCPYNDTIKDRECVCQEGTCGIQCRYCCPAYNQYPFKSGTLGPFTMDNDAACEKCNCYGHSDVCVYNQTVANNNCSYGNNATNDECSMDIFGRYSGGGVCVGCKDNTEGINCQRCITNYYREEGKSHRDHDACQPCDCFVNGTMNSTRNGVEYLDCVRDVEEAAELGDLAPGQCLCKNKTTGRQCDRCIDGYYNLTAENPQGCLACLCITSGTVSASINCDDNGVCSCKQRVVGDKCSRCQNGTFNLADNNQDGCTECMCSGITQNCTSSSMYRSKSRYNVEGWNLTRGFKESEVITTMNIQEEMNGVPVDLISVNVSTGELLYWTTVDDYFNGNSLVTSYGGYLEFTRKVSFVHNGTLQTTSHIIIKGPRNVTIETNLPELNLTTQSPVVVSAKMVEFGWTYLNSSTVVDRSTFMLVLSKPEKIWITASYFTSGNGTYQTSFGNLQISSVTNTSNGNNMAVDVEQCSCGVAYQGSSCERCARGYHRINVAGHPFFGQCIPCNCHGHTEDCDPDTGRCLDCQHNTTGFNCTECRDGFFGNARNGTENDCQKCPCEPPKTTTDLCVMLSNGSAQCLNCSEGYEKNLECNRCEFGYFGRPFLEGGNCSLCQCNNNSDICDRENGSCLAYCENNSTGWHCERCENGTYGNATKQQCRACTCDETGSYDIPCDFRTGHCHCKPNVQGFNCSECEENTYGFSDTGCLECNCNEFGSVSLQCNDSGICLCKNHTYGDKCDACIDEYYGLPNATCQDCACNATGSNSSVCDHVTGMCPCKPGVEGRQCDRCKVQHKDFSDIGCEPCPPCTMKLQGIVDDASNLLMTSKLKADQASESIDFYTDLEVLEGEIPRVQTLQEEHSNVINRLEEYRKTLTNTSLNETILSLEERERDLTSEAKTLTQSLSSEIERVGNISDKTKSSNDLARDVKSKTEMIVGNLESLSNQSQAYNESSSSAVDFLVQSISEAESETRRANNLTNAVERMSNETQSAGVMVENQGQLIVELSTMIQQFNGNLTNTNELIGQGELEENTTRGEIEDVTMLVSETNATVENTSATLQQTSSYINDSNTFLKDGEANYENVTDARLPKLNRELEKLKSNIDNVNVSYTTPRAVVANATVHADNLTAHADKLARNFSEARAHGEKAVTAINEYNRTTETINRSVKLSMVTSKAVNESIQRIQNLTMANQSVTARALDCKDASDTLLTATRARNVDITEKNNSVSVAFEVFNAANETCNTVETYASIFENKCTLIINVAASERPAINSSLQNATEHVSLAQNISDKIQLESIELKKRLMDANNTLAKMNELISNSSQLLEETHMTGNDTEVLLANISLSVNLTKQIKQENERIEQFLLNKTAILERKLQAAKDKVAKFRLAMKVQGNTSVQYRPTPRLISNPLLNSVSLDFKTNRSSGLLLYMSPIPNNTHQSISLKLVVNRVRFTYKIDSSPVVITNWEVEIQNDVWYRAYATRYRDQARLTVTNLASGFSRTYEGPNRIVSDLEMKFNVNSSVFLAGLPSNEKANFSERYFDGVLDNLVLNEDQVPLWEPAAVEGVRKYFAKRVQEKDNSTGFCTTFHGNGFVQQLAGELSTRMNSSLAFQFRTFLNNALLVLVEGSDKEFIYSVYLNNGRVIFHYNNTRLASVRSNYNDGQWYHVSVTRTLKNASLHITNMESESNNVNDYVNQSSRMPVYLPEAQYVYFGGTNETRDRFAGGMKHIFIHSLVQNKEIARNLNDKNLTVKSSGVSEDQCWDQVERGLHYSDGYSAVNTENITSLTSLVIRFKTSEPSGLLAYSFKENVHFYVALFHGNLFLIYGNGSSIVRLQTQTQTRNDGAYHTLTITISNSRIQMSIKKVNEDNGIYDRTLTGNIPRGLPTPIPLENLYFAGIPSNIWIPLQVPVIGSFNGDFADVQVNGETLFNGSSTSVFTSAVSVGVSVAGVSPSMIVRPTSLPTAPPPPPTCGQKYLEKVRSEKQHEVHFEGDDSVVALNVNRSLINEMAESFVISMEFRALSPNGVLFMAANNDTSQFVSLELVDGNIVYQFNTGNGLIQTRTRGTYSVGGVWYRVDLLRIRQFGAMVVRGTSEYHKNGSENVDGEALNVNQFFVGGVTADVNSSVLENPKGLSFFGCIRDVEIQTRSRIQNLNLSGDSIPSRTRNIQPGQCYDYVQPQVGFDGAGFAELVGEYDMSAGSELSITFRTTKRSGLLFYAANRNRSQRMAIEQVNGQIHLSYILNNVHTKLEWVDPVIRSPENVNNSYALCDNIYHTVNVKRYIDHVELDVDGGSMVTSNITDSGGFTGTVYVGGIPSGLHVNVGVTGQRFVGCVESVYINSHIVDFKHGTAQQEFMEYGCRAPPRPQESYAGSNFFVIDT